MIRETVERELWTSVGRCKIVHYDVVTPEGTFRLRRYYRVARVWLRVDDRGVNGEEIPMPGPANDVTGLVRV